MALTTYEYYKNEWYGVTVPEEQFNKWLSKAEDQLNDITNGNITTAAVEEYGTQIQKAVCELVDMLYLIDTARNKATGAAGGVVTARTSGDESVTYKAQENEITAALSSRTATDRLLFDVVRKHLARTGLLYQGL